MDIQVPGAYYKGPSPSPLSTRGPIKPAVQSQQMQKIRRTQRAPKQFQDILPEPPLAIPASKRRLPTVYLMVTNPFKTATNAFGLFRNYLFHPSHDPDELINPSDLTNITTPAPPPSLPCS